MTAQPDASGWTGPRITLLINHYQAGLSAAESAILIGGVSKNAVVSKRRRLGLFATLRGPTENGVAARSEAYVRIRPFRGPPPLPTEPLPEMDQVRPLDCSPRRLVDRGADRCAWPLGPAEEPADYRTLFCGAPARTASSYCPLHAERARRR
jgi:GcrA cell cycle regulator